MAKTAAPYQEGPEGRQTWSMRRRLSGHDIYVRGHKSKAAAAKAMAEEVGKLDKRGVPLGLGPHKTCVAQALQDYGRRRLRFKKGARQEADRINRYLRAAGLDTLKITPWEAAVAAGKATATGREKDRK